MGIDAVKTPSNEMMRQALADTGPLGQVASFALPYLIEYGTNAAVEYFAGTPAVTITTKEEANNEKIAQVASDVIGTVAGTGVGTVGMGVAAVGLTAFAVGLTPVVAPIVGAGAAIGVLAIPVGKVAKTASLWAARRAI